MKYLKNVSTKIIGGLGEAFLPGTAVLYTEELERHPVVKFYISKKILKVSDSEAMEDESPKDRIAEEEKARIAQEAVDAYRKQMEEEEARKDYRRGKLTAIKAMKKAELEEEAVKFGVELTGSETCDQLRDMLIAQIPE